jgi:hypothetical protein
MDLDTQELVKAVNESVKELHLRIDRYFWMVAEILNDQAGGHKPHSDLDCLPWQVRERRLTRAIEEAIVVLEQSRKSFKSKQLEALRKKLTQVLIDKG